jgi:hypothetical protein
LPLYKVNAGVAVPARGCGLPTAPNHKRKSTKLTKGIYRMKKRMQIVIASLAILAGFAWNQSQALAQAEKFDATGQLRNRVWAEPPVIEQVGPLTRLTVRVVWTMTASDPRLSGVQDVTGVWMIDPRDGTSVGHGKYTMALTEGGEVEGTWCVDKSGTMRATGFVTGGELDGAILNIVSVAGHPFLGWVDYEVRTLLPASE